MTNSVLSWGIIAGLVLIMGGWLVWAGVSKDTVPGGEVACTMEAKLCPDGSAVGRTGPNCEFAACPTATSTPVASKGTVTGKVFLSPVCPVEITPQNPMCARIGYQTTVEARSAGKTAIVATAQSNGQGAFSINLPAGTYVLTAKGGAVYPRCGSVTVEVRAGGTISADIDCDTGIRGPTPAPTEVNIEGKIGQTVSGLGASITPLSVVQDSRCPVDVTCIQAGTVQIKARIVSGLGTSDMTLTLGTPITTETQEITLVSVSPAPYAGVTIPQNSYVFTFSIKKR